ncbi:FtsX-like permease family protein [Lachnospiraceae bacterium WCA-9-b2]|uniref:FtsX-like permease family protein n=1 Tax=Sporofaciens musculi TaxID=2681861 RepID=A0A7X3MEN2_9FIRM|nr:ABC transporter permease [Sporofaciens musculi]MXP74915.1 FtsX-like permease family protein [Sporofaciens musculi]
MSWIDLLRMSGSNLKRRKLRTFLTVLGVIIGTASIVVMISLGLGLQESLYQEVENSGGLTSIKVTGANAGDSMVSYSSGDSGEESKKYINDQVISELSKIENVTIASPVYEMWVNMIKGKYEGNGQLVAMTPEGLVAKNIPLAEGKLPASGGSTLEVVYGNGIPTMFYEKGSGKSYYETMELPDIDFIHDSIFMILDQDGYYNSMGSGMDMGGDENGGQQAKSNTVQKHVVRACGMVQGGPDEYNANYYYIYCDLDTLKQILKKEFSGRAIPGQPTTKSGKPYKEFCYTYAQVNVDDIDNVDKVAAIIREKGYNVETNAEYLNSMKSQFAIIQAVLGGIGAVSLFVAAIGIANTMMMSIYERTKEIGVIKVLGCSLKNIKQMFLLEAAFIGLLGGMMGNVLSFLMSAVINFLTRQGATSMGFSSNISYIPPWLVLLSMGFAMLVGVIAGYFPALRAMKLSPLAAIRNE